MEGGSISPVVLSRPKCKLSSMLDYKLHLKFLPIHEIKTGQLYISLYFFLLTSDHVCCLNWSVVCIHESYAPGVIMNKSRFQTPFIEKLFKNRVWHNALNFWLQQNVTNSDNVIRPDK